MRKNKHLIYLIFLIVVSSTNSWSQTNIPPTVTGSGNQIYCPQSQINITTSFNITDPDDIEIEAFYIQISTGYINGEDTLSLTGTHPSITTSWNALEGKLTLTDTGGGNILYTDLIPAVTDVVFESSNPTPSGQRSFSLTVGDANYLPSSDHFYEYVADLGILWTNAKTEAEARTYFGLQGYLATITSTEEAQLSGEQASGAGWIGGSDASTEGIWKWVTGPETGTIFWNGNFTGSTPNYAFWNINEPNQAGDEDYAHVTAPGIGTPGSWNDLSNTGAASGDYQPKGYIVEYGGMPGDPTLNISASTQISIASIDNTIPNERCGSGTVSLTATATAGNVLWYDTPTGGTLLSIGSLFTTPSISSTTTYYAYASENGCLSGGRIPVIATINEIPTITSINEDTLCQAGSSTLSATASAGIINWYENAVGGTSIATGNTFVTPSISVSTTYYIDATQNGCTTLTRTSITLNIQYVNSPNGSNIQSFCDIENATINDLIIVGSNILIYSLPTGGTPLNNTDTLSDSTTYYASQTINDCESPTRLLIDIIINDTVTPITVTPLENCDNNSVGNDADGFIEFNLTDKNIDILNGSPSSDFEIRYYTDPGFINQIPVIQTTSYPNSSNPQPIYIRVLNNTDNSCFTTNSFELIVNELPTLLNTSVTLIQCDDDLDRKEEFNLELNNNEISSDVANETFTYYESLLEAETGNINNEIPNPLTYINQVLDNDTVWARIENVNGCFRTAEINLDVNPSSAIMDDFGLREFFTCDDGTDLNDGIATFDFSSVTNEIQILFPSIPIEVYYYQTEEHANTHLPINQINPSNYQNTNSPFFQEIWVRIDSDLGSDCLAKGQYVQLNTLSLPEFEVISDRIVCLNLPPIILEIFNPDGIYTYQWFDPNNNIISNDVTTVVSSGGNYTVIATSTNSSNCESIPKVVTVTESIVASIDIDDITITDDSDNNTITINTTNLGIGDYKFALDDAFGIYQNESFFENVAPGIHTIYIRDENNCGIEDIEVSVIGFPKFFTPNNDGENDTWQIKGVSTDFFPTSLIYIYDRFGKLVAQVDATNEGWNGFYNGKILPSTDYWFTAKLIDQDGNTRDKKGHFSLIRRTL